MGVVVGSRVLLCQVESRGNKSWLLGAVASL